MWTEIQCREIGRRCVLKETQTTTIQAENRRGEIEYKSEVKYLGVTLDSKLHWTSHIEEKLKKAKNYLGKIAHMTRNNWGPKPRLMRWAYTGIVRPMFCYGAMIWGHRAPELMEKFRRLNRMAINTFASFPKSTPTIALEVMLEVMPLHLVCVQEAVAARVRLDNVLEFGWHGTSHTKRHATSHMKFLQERLGQYRIDPRNTDVCSSLQWNKGFKINWSSFDGTAKHRQLSQVNAYTDGSKIKEQTGAGMVAYKGRGEILREWYRLPDGCTVFQAEVAAVASMADALSEVQDGSVKYVKIFIDSQAAISAIGNPLVKSKIVERAVDSLNRLAETAISVTLVWIPAHKGHDGNEVADELAKKGAAESDTRRCLDVGQPMATLKANIRGQIYKEWLKEWNASATASHTKSFYAGPNPGKARFVYKLARLELGRFVRIITGHNNLGFFQTKISLGNNAACRFCEEGVETMTHLLYGCPAFHESRREIFNDRLPTNDMKWSVRDLLNFSFIPGINEAFEGTWADGDPLPMPMDASDESLGLDFLDESMSGNESSGEQNGSTWTDQQEVD